MPCEERRILLSDYSKAARAYADSVGKMTDLAGLGLRPEFDLLRRTCRTAWEASERARLALYRHEANHGCDRSDFAPSVVAAVAR